MTRLAPVFPLFLVLACSGTVPERPLNFHEVDPGLVYRSADPGDRLPRLVEEYNLKAVIDLTGNSTDFDRCRELGIACVSIGMSARRLPHREDLLGYLHAVGTLPRPLLIHCEAGADRTGEAVALYMIDFWGYESNVASALALSPVYGHFRERHPAKSYFVEEVYQGAEWATDGYRPCEMEWEHYDKGRYCER